LRRLAAIPILSTRPGFASVRFKTFYRKSNKNEKLDFTIRTAAGFSVCPKLAGASHHAACGDFLSVATDQLTQGCGNSGGANSGFQAAT
jgi:hypothetical protein